MAIERMFREMERFSEENNVELEWETFSMDVGPQQDPMIPPHARMIEIHMSMDGVKRGD